MNGVLKKVLVVGACITALVGCTNEKSAQRVLEGAGYSSIQFTGYQLFSCGEGDFYHTGFKALGPTGKSVEGCVCEGMMFKNSTIRIK